MSLFQCENCGCVENTALSSQGHAGIFAEFFDWSKIPHLEGKRVCSACGPTHYKDGSPSAYGGGRWHEKFDRVYLPKGMFITNRVGNLEHKETGEENYTQYLLSEEEK